MFNVSKKMFHKILSSRVLLPISSSGILASVVVGGSEHKDEQEDKIFIRPRDLAIYSKPARPCNKSEGEPQPESVLLSAVRQVREALWTVTGQISQASDNINYVFSTGKAHASSTIQILRDEDNYAQRYGAIAVGGLICYMVAWRRGRFRRLVYTTTGAAAVAAVCYPQEAREYSTEAFREGKHYFIIAYHFINGVLRDYVGVQLPSLPGPLSDTPTSATLLPPPTVTLSHITKDSPQSVTDKKKQG